MNRRNVADATHGQRALRVLTAAVAAFTMLATLPGMGAVASAGRTHTAPRAAAAERLLGHPVPAEVLDEPLAWQVLEGVPTTGGLTLDTAVASTGADEVWRQTTGTGSVVALVDTGVAPVPALDGAVAGEVDFTGTGGGDGYGHGTFMASLIAGRGPVAPGVAPGAGVLSLKVADAEGATSLGTVLGALDWLAGPGRALGVKVAVLALGVEPDSAAGEVIDLATERLANLGVLVVTSSGNSGPGNVMAPATSPTSVSVGAVDDQATADRGDDVVASFSADGADRVGVAQPDLVASGVRVVGSIGADSVVARENPQAIVGDGLFRGSGTSMSAALAAGVAALVGDVRPDLHGDGLARALTSSAELDAAAAVSAALTEPAVARTMVAPPAARGFTAAVDGLARERAQSLATIEQRRLTERAAAEQRHGRRTVPPAAPAGAGLTGALAAIDARAAQDARRVVDDIERRMDALEATLAQSAVAAPSAHGWSPAVWEGSSWSTGEWATERWAAHDWSAPASDRVGWDSVLGNAYGLLSISWDPQRWDAQRWDAQRWDAQRWDAQRWDAGNWEAVHWGAVRWDAQRWDAQRWDAQRWDAQRWDAVHWGAGEWAAVHWGANSWTAVQWGAVQWGAVQWGAQRWDAVQWGAQRWDAVQWGAQRWDAVQWGALDWPRADLAAPS